MKFLITKAEYDALDPAMQALYKARGDGFQMQIEGLPEQEDLSGLKAQVASLLNEKKNAKEAQTAAEKAAQDAADEIARKNGDVAALDASYKTKIDELTAGHTSQLAGYQKTISDLTIGATANEIAAKVFGKNASIMLPHVLNRLSLEEADGKPTVRVLKDGQPSAATVEDLQKEFTNNPDYASVVVGSKAGGAPQGGTKPVTQTPGAFGQNAMRDRALEIAQGIQASGE